MFLGHYCRAIDENKILPYNFLLIIFNNLPILYKQILKLTVFSIHYLHVEIIMATAIIKNH